MVTGFFSLPAGKQLPWAVSSNWLLRHWLNCPFRYPYNLDFDFGGLKDLNKFSINNLGDPFIESNYGVHSREFEVRLLCLIFMEV